MTNSTTSHRIPVALQSVFLASNRGNDVKYAPLEASKVFGGTPSPEHDVNVVEDEHSSAPQAPVCNLLVCKQSKRTLQYTHLLTFSHFFPLPDCFSSGISRPATPLPWVLHPTPRSSLPPKTHTPPRSQLRRVPHKSRPQPRLDHLSRRPLLRHFTQPVQPLRRIPGAHGVPARRF